MGTLGGAMYTHHPFHVFCASFFSFMMLAPTLWWFSKAARQGQVRSANIFYENSCTPEEVERFRHQDMVENLGYTMVTQQGYGYFKQADPKSV